MKQKIGTVVDQALYDDVKVLAAQERRRIADIVQLALAEYVQRAKARRSERVCLDRLLEKDPLPPSAGMFDYVITDPPYKRP
jgi:hypothetical protein